MIGDLFSAASSLLPWVLGAICGMKVAEITPEIRGGPAIFAGIGGFFGMLIFALAIWLLDQRGISVLNETFLIFLWVAVSIATVSFSIKLYFQRICLNITPNYFVVLAVCLAYICVWGFLLLNMPVVGWDVVDHWALVAKLFVEHSLSGDAQPFYYHFYHPKTLSLILSWSGWLSFAHGGDGQSLWAAPFVAYTLSFLLIVIGFSFNQTRNCRISIIIGLLALTMPLLENHFFIAGYAEIPLGLVMLSAVAVSVIAINERSLSLLLAGVAFPFASVFLKGAGPIYLLAPLLGIVAARLIHCHLVTQLTFYGLCVAAATYIVSHGFVIQIAGHALGYDAGLKAFLLPGRQPLQLFIPSASDLFINIFHSRFLNSSFSIGSLIGGLAFVEIIRNQRTENASALRVVFFTFCLLLFEQFSSQFTYYGFNFAVPGNDTGFSRFSLPAFMLLPLLVACLMTPDRLAKAWRWSPDKKNLKNLGHKATVSPADP